MNVVNNLTPVKKHYEDSGLWEEVSKLPLAKLLVRLQTDLKDLIDIELRFEAGTLLYYTMERVMDIDVLDQICANLAQSIYETAEKKLLENLGEAWPEPDWVREQMLPHLRSLLELCINAKGLTRMQLYVLSMAFTLWKHSSKDQLRESYQDLMFRGFRHAGFHEYIRKEGPNCKPNSVRLMLLKIGTDFVSYGELDQPRMTKFIKAWYAALMNREDNAGLVLLQQHLALETALKHTNTDQ